MLTPVLLSNTKSATQQVCAEPARFGRPDYPTRVLKNSRNLASVMNCRLTQASGAASGNRVSEKAQKTDQDKIALVVLRVIRVGRNLSVTWLVCESGFYSHERA